MEAAAVRFSCVMLTAPGAALCFGRPASPPPSTRDSGLVARLLLGLKGPVSPANPLSMGLTNGFAGRSQLAVTEELGDHSGGPVLDLASPALNFELSITPVQLGTPRTETHCWCIQRKHMHGPHSHS